MTGLNRRVRWGLLGGLVVLLGAGVFMGTRPVTVISRPVGIMGTRTQLTVVVGGLGRLLAVRSLRDAEDALRDVEAKMSTWLADSEISRFNASAAGQEMELSPETMEVLRAAQRFAEQTDGAFDVTCRPIVELWKQAEKDQRLPADAALAAAREKSTWKQIELRDGGAVKHVATAGVDLGGIAKGYAIDRAVEAMERAGVRGGLVEVGGDVRCFGRRDRQGGWEVGIRSPFDPDAREHFAILKLAAGAVCTSGNYFRFREISGRRYSHIVDPRTARPADAAPSVTVVAPTAMTADAWATALSVLGPGGLRLLRPGGGIEAMLVVGGPRDYRIHMTDGFRALLAKPPPAAPAPKKGT